MRKAYEVIFENDNGKAFTFGPRGKNRFAINMAEGMEVALGRSQGFAQVGETVETQSIGGRTLDVSGEFYGPIPERKNALRSVCTPLSAGRLVFQGSHSIRVWVKAAPSFSAVRDNGLFKMQFFAPYPFYTSLEETYFLIGRVIPKFRFPVNYGQSHRFGSRDLSKAVNVKNGGDVPTAFRLVFRSDGTSTNPRVTDLNRLTFLKLNGILFSGESVTIYRDENQVLRAELSSGNTIRDVISWIDEESSLFELAAGDNLIAATDDEGGMSLTVSFSFREAVGVLYET